MNKETTPLQALNYFLEKQDNLEKYGSSGGFSITEQREKLTIIQNALKRLEEIDKYLYLNNRQLKAFEIIKKKGLSVNDIAFIRNGESWETYVETMKQLYWGDDHLDRVLKTQEEYDLLKEVLL